MDGQILEDGEHVASVNGGRLWVGSFRTFGNLLAAIDLGDLLLDELVALLTDLDDLGTGNT